MPHEGALPPACGLPRDIWSQKKMTVISSEGALVELVRGANGPLRVIGGGTRGPIGAAGEPLSVAGLKGITLYEPGALTVVAAAGTPLTEIETTHEA